MLKITVIKGIIFDLDGVITDTSEYHYRSWQKLADDLGIPFDRQKNERFRGISRMECLEILLAGEKDISAEEKNRLADRKNNYYRAYLEEIDEENILPGARELLAEARKKDLKIAVASSSKNTRTVLENLGLKDEFDVIADGNSVQKTKPAPDIFLHTAEELNLAPEKCAVIEDAESGIEAALAADMLVIGIGPVSRVGKAHICYNTVADIDLDDIF